MSNGNPYSKTHTNFLIMFLSVFQMYLGWQQQQNARGHLHQPPAAAGWLPPNRQQPLDVRLQLPASLRWGLAAQLTSRYEQMIIIETNCINIFLLWFTVASVRQWRDNWLFIILVPKVL